jgi:hypothetical protein
VVHAADFVEAREIRVTGIDDGDDSPVVALLGDEIGTT